MLFQIYGDRRNSAVLFFHAMGVTGESSEPVVNYLQDRYFCILPTSTVYCEGAEICQQAGRNTAGGGLSASTGRGKPCDGGRFFYRRRPCHGVFDKHEVAHWTRFLRWRAVCANRKRYAPHYDTVSVFRYQEPVLVEGRHTEKDSVV